MSNFGLSDQERLFLLKKLVAQKNKDALHEWVELHYGVVIPRCQICEGHDAPFDFFADYIFDNFDNFLVMANRSGGKTYMFAILDSLMSYLLGGLESATTGAIRSQAQKCYSYFKEFTDKFPFSEHVESSTMNKTAFDNGALVQVLTGTMSGVNSPHPHHSKIDEFELMPWPIVQQAISMAQGRDGIRSKTVFTSTRKFASGPMQRMIKEADKRGLKFFKWCIWEVIEPLPKDDPELMKEIMQEFGDSLPKNIDKANGYYSWRDAINKHRSLDPEIWENEWLCRKPGMEGVIYGSSFDIERNVLPEEHSTIGLDGKKAPGSYFIVEDFGNSKNHPNVYLFAHIPPENDRIIIFDELYFENGETFAKTMKPQVLAKLQENGLTIQDVSGWIPDPHNLGEIQIRHEEGMPVLPKSEEKGAYIITNGISTVRRLFASTKLLISPRCVTLISEVQTYRWKKNADGTYSNVPDKNYDHGPDCIRYLTIIVHRLLSWGRSVNMDTGDDVKPISKYQNLMNLAKDYEDDDFDEVGSVTAGLYGKEF